MAITIPEDFSFASRLVRPAFYAYGLTNSLYSWEKERDDGKKAGAEYIVNAIWVIMGERSTTEEEAKNICRQKFDSLFWSSMRLFKRPKPSQSSRKV